MATNPKQTTENEASKKKGSNPFKKAAEKQKKAPGGDNVQQTTVTAPAAVPVPEEKVVVTETPAKVEPEEKAKAAQPVDMMAFIKEQSKTPKKPEKVRKQFVIPKTLDDKLKKALKNKEIPSENQLINDLLNSFFEGKLLYRGNEE